MTVPGPQNSQPIGILFSSTSGNSIVISDAAAGNKSIQVTVTATNGLITLASTQGLTLGFGNGQQDAQIVMTGPVADINAAMNGMLFRPTAQAAQLQIAANDLGNSGAGVPLTASGTVAITQIPLPVPPSPPIVIPVVPGPIVPSPQPPAPPVVTPTVPPVPPNPIPPPKQPATIPRHAPAATSSLDASMPQISLPEASAFLAADSKPWAHAPARLGSLSHAKAPLTANAEANDVAQGSPLWNDLNAMDRKLLSQLTTQEFAIGTALTVSTGFTVGYVLWLLRGGVLLSSLLAQMPAWRLVDPLVVLNGTNDGEKDGEQETLETIVDSLEDHPVEPAVTEEILA
jgi:hypothetical protein